MEEIKIIQIYTIIDYIVNIITLQTTMSDKLRQGWTISDEFSQSQSNISCHLRKNMIECRCATYYRRQCRYRRGSWTWAPSTRLHHPIVRRSKISRRTSRPNGPRSTDKRPESRAVRHRLSILQENFSISEFKQQETYPSLADFAQFGRPCREIKRQRRA